MAFHTSGATVPAGKLALYTLVTMSGAAGVGFLTERGNIKTLGTSDAALFGIPNDFTKTP